MPEINVGLSVDILKPQLSLKSIKHIWIKILFSFLAFAKIDKWNI